MTTAEYANRRDAMLDRQERAACIYVGAACVALTATWVYYLVRWLT